MIPFSSLREAQTWADAMAAGAFCCKIGDQIFMVNPHLNIAIQAFNRSRSPEAA
jgi:hypothetical protein